MGWSLPEFIALHVSLWSVGDLLMMSFLEPKLDFRSAFYWLLRELLSLPLWVSIASGNTVNWRGKQLKLQSGGVLEQIS